MKEILKVEMMVRLPKKVNKPVKRCFYQSSPIRRGQQKQLIAVWREIETFEITEQRLVDQLRVIRTNEWLIDMELEEIKRKILTPRDGEEIQDINDIRVIEERMKNEYSSIQPNETEIRVRIETEITVEERLIIDELKALMIRHDTEDYLTFKRADQRKLKDVTNSDKTY